MDLFDREAEISLLGSILRNGKNLDSVFDVVKPEHFSWIPYKTVYRTMLDCRENGTAIDSIVIGGMIQNINDITVHSNTSITGRKALTYIRGTEDTESPVEYAIIVKNLAQKRAFLERMTNAANELNQGRELPHILADLTSSLSTIDSHTVAKTQTFDHALSQAFDQTTLASKGEISYISTGYDALDRIIVGFSAPDLTILAARPGVGKTALMANMIYSIIKKTDKKVALFTLEMSAPQMAMRFISLDCGLSFHKQRTGNLADHEFDRYYKSIANLEEHKHQLYLNDVESISVNQIRSELRKIPKVDIVFVDYLQLATADKEQEHRHQEVAYIVRSLKGIAKEFNVPVVALAQISREVEKRGRGSLPIMADLAESVAIEQTADVIMFLHRAKDENEIMSDEAKVIVVKQRNGPIGHMTLDYQGETTRFLRHI